MYSAIASSDSIVHLHAVRTGLLHVDGGVFAGCLSSFTDRVYLPHLDY